MKKALRLFLFFIVIASVLHKIGSAPVPTPDPCFPYTILPPKGKGHRKHAFSSDISTKASKKSS